MGASSAAARARDEKSSPTSHEVAVTRTLLTGSAAIAPPLRKVTCSVPGASTTRAYVQGFRRTRSAPANCQLLTTYPSSPAAMNRAASPQAYQPEPGMTSQPPSGAFGHVGTTVT